MNRQLSKVREINSTKGGLVFANINDAKGIHAIVNNYYNSGVSEKVIQLMMNSYIKQIEYLQKMLILKENQITRLLAVTDNERIKPKKPLRKKLDILKP